MEYVPSLALIAANVLPAAATSGQLMTAFRGCWREDTSIPCVGTVVISRVAGETASLGVESAAAAVMHSPASIISAAPTTLALPRSPDTRRSLQAQRVDVGPFGMDSPVLARSARGAVIAPSPSRYSNPAWRAFSRSYGLIGLPRLSRSTH